MPTRYTFGVELDSSAISPFDRYDEGQINIDGRYGPLDTDPGYTVVVSATPQRVEPNGATSVGVLVRKRGLPLAGQTVYLYSTDEAVGAVADYVIAGSNGDAIFQVVGASLGTTYLSAAILVDGVTYYSEPVLLTVSTQAAPENYDATGYGRIVLTGETPIANAMHPRTQRLSHAEQLRKHKTDHGLKWATHFESATITVVPKALQI